MRSRGRKVLKKVVVFKLGEQKYGVDIEFVNSIERLTEITKVPNAPNFMKGIIHLRGDIIPIIDLKERLGMEGIKPTNQTRIIIIQMQNLQIGLLVDAATDVLDIDVAIVDTITAFHEGIDKEYIEGVAKLADVLLILLRLDKILQPNEYNQVAEIVSERQAQ